MESHERLEVALQKRSNDLGFGWTKLAKKAGVTTETLRKLRKGVHRPSVLTARRLEDALRWEPGTVKKICDGTIEPDAAAQTSRSVTDGDDLPVTFDVMRQILEAFLESGAESEEAVRNALRILDTERDRRAEDGSRARRRR